MIDLTVIGLNDRDMELINGLTLLGLPRREATLMIYLSGVTEATSKEIERATLLRQPEVSMGMRFLRVNGWVNEREVEVDGNGRPYKVYSLRTTLQEIVSRYEAQRLEKSTRSMEAIQKLKELRYAKAGKE